MKLFKRVLPYLIAVSMATNGYAVPLLATTSDTTTGGSTQQANSIETFQGLEDALENNNTKLIITKMLTVNTDKEVSLDLRNNTIEFQTPTNGLDSIPIFDITEGQLAITGNSTENQITSPTQKTENDYTYNGEGFRLSSKCHLKLYNLYINVKGNHGILISSESKDENERSSIELNNTTIGSPITGLKTSGTGNKITLNNSTINSGGITLGGSGETLTIKGNSSLEGIGQFSLQSSNSTVTIENTVPDTSTILGFYIDKPTTLTIQGNPKIDGKGTNYSTGLYISESAEGSIIQLSGGTFSGDTAAIQIHQSVGDLNSLLVKDYCFKNDKGEVIDLPTEPDSDGYYKLTGTVKVALKEKPTPEAIKVTPAFSEESITKVYDGTIDVENPPTVTFKSDDPSVDSNALANLKATTKFTYADAKVGANKNINVSITLDSGNVGNYELIQPTAPLTGSITARPTTLSFKDIPETVLENKAVTLTAQVGNFVDGEFFTGEVTFKENEKTLGTAIVNSQTGVATLEWTATEAGKHQITASYDPKNENYEGSTNNISIEVTKEQPIITQVTPILNGEGITKVYDGMNTVNGTPKITFKSADPNDTTDLTGLTAEATFTYNDATVGENKTITANDIKLTGENSDKYTLTQNTTTFTGATITAKPTTLSLKATSETVLENETVTLTAQVGDFVKGESFTGEVTFKEGEKALGTATVDSQTGIATFDWTSTEAGEHQITATYNPQNTNYVEATNNLSINVIKEFEQTLVTPQIQIEDPDKAYDGTTDVEDTPTIIFEGYPNVTATADFAYESDKPGKTFIVASNITLDEAFKEDYVLSTDTAKLEAEITKQPFTLTVNADKETAQKGDTLSLQAEVNASMPNELTGSVQFTLDTNGQEMPLGDVAPLTNGKATTNWIVPEDLDELTSGNYQVSATFTPNESTDYFELSSVTPFNLTLDLTTDDPTPDEPTPDEPTPDDPTPDDPTPDEPTPDDPTPDDPTPDDPTPDEPTPDDPIPDEPTPDDPIPDEPTPDDPTPDDPTPDDLTPDDPTPDDTSNNITFDVSRYQLPSLKPAPFSSQVELATNPTDQKGTLTITEALIKDKIEEAKNQAKQNGTSVTDLSLTFVIPNTDQMNTDPITLTLDEGTLDALIKANVKQVTFKHSTKNQSVSFDLKALQSLNEQASSVAISIGSVPQDKLALFQDVNQFIGPLYRPTVEVNLYDQDGHAITQFGEGHMKLSFGGYTYNQQTGQWEPIKKVETPNNNNRNNLKLSLDDNRLSSDMIVIPFSSSDSNIEYLRNMLRNYQMLEDYAHSTTNQTTSNNSNSTDTESLEVYQDLNEPELYVADQPNVNNSQNTTKPNVPNAAPSANTSTEEENKPTTEQTTSNSTASTGTGSKPTTNQTTSNSTASTGTGNKPTMHIAGVNTLSTSQLSGLLANNTAKPKEETTDNATSTTEQTTSNNTNSTEGGNKPTTEQITSNNTNLTKKRRKIEKKSGNDPTVTPVTPITPITLPNQNNQSGVIINNPSGVVTAQNALAAVQKAINNIQGNASKGDLNLNNIVTTHNTTPTTEQDTSNNTDSTGIVTKPLSPNQNNSSEPSEPVVIPNSPSVKVKDTDTREPNLSIDKLNKPNSNNVQHNITLNAPKVNLSTIDGKLAVPHASIYGYIFVEPIEFTDTANHPSKNFINWATARGLFDNLEDGGTFRPDEAIHKDEFVTALDRLFESSDSLSKLNVIASSKGLKYKELAMILVDYAKLMHHSLIPVVDEKDYTKIDSIYNEKVQEAVTKLQKAGILEGSVSPDATVTRATACEILHRYVAHFIDPNAME